MAETYHGVEIPDDLWSRWNDGFADDVTGFRIGVISALGIPVNDDRNWSETGRLEALADARDEAETAAAETAAFEERHKDEPWMQRRLAFRKAMEEKTDGTS